MLVVAPIATSIAAQSAAAATGDTDPVVKFAYVDSSSGNVTLATASGDTIDMGVSAEIVGRAANLDDDYYVEVPYVNENNELRAIDRTGEDVLLADQAKKSKTKVAVGDFDGDGTNSVYYARETSTSGGDFLMRVNYSSAGSPQFVTDDFEVEAAVGVGNFSADAGDELALVGQASGQVMVWDGSSSTRLSDKNPSNPGAIGAPRDFDGDGTASVPIVDGSGNVRLLYANGTSESIHAGAKKDPIAAVDWAGDATPELLYLQSNSPANLAYTYLNGTADTVTLDGSEVNPALGAGVAAAADTDEPLEFSNFSVTNESNSLRVSFDATEDLQSVSVTVSGPDGTDLSLSDFDEVSLSGDYTYVANYTPVADGTYEGTLESGTAMDGDAASPGVTDSATIDRMFDVTNLNATAAPGQDVNVSFEATDALDSLTLTVDGAENATLDLDNFSTSDSSAPYVYNGTYDGSSDGNYTVTFDSATSPEGTDDDDLVDEVTIDQVFRTWNFTLANESGKLGVSFEADERLSATTVDITGPSNRTLGVDDFSVSDTDDGYRYGTAYVPDANGEYNGTLASATSLDGQETSPGYEDNATIDRGFTVWNLTLNTTADGDLRFGFNSTAGVESASLGLSGAENETLDRSDLDEISSSDPYRYEGTHAVATDGNYTLALDSASTGVNTFDGTLTANATRNQTGVALVNATLRDATNADGIVNASDAVTITANATGDVGSVTADASAFGAGTVELTHASGDTYTATVGVDADDTAGNETATVTARDGQGAVATDTSGDILLDAVAPTVAVGANRTVDVGESVTFAPDTASDDASGVADYTWNLGPAVADNRTTTYAYETAGTYTVSLAVTDDAGNTETAALTVTVTADTTTDTPTETTTTETATDESTTTTATATTTTTTVTTTDGAPAATADDTTTTTAATTTAATATTTTTTAAATSTTDTDPNATSTESTASVPGFGVVVAVLALLGVALLARRD
ncbi:hypothetical protein GCM10009019_11140 [Salarchaeum japonicum]|uniref:PKD domain-containing protein n=2 Tax=Salarchaeum japonicum TaxID=555573 RepID=A0AAV3T0Q9_9EURY